MSDIKWIDEYEMEAWTPIMGSEPVEQVRHLDRSEPYECDEAHVFRLANGKYATVIERGCSCYEASDAKIEVFPTLEAAVAAYEKWEKA